MIKSYYTDHDLLVVLGPTATGKTRLAVQLANELEGEIISADSRQVYRGMDIGTGKDLNEYNLKGKTISYHLIDITDPQEEYNVFQFQKDFQKIFLNLHKYEKLPILCGGTGFYIKAVLMDFHLPLVSPDNKLRKELENWEMDDLILELESISSSELKNSSLETKRRIIRNIEVERNSEKGQQRKRRINLKINNPIVLGIEYPREIIRERITERLHERLDQGMVHEVEILIDRGITHEQLDRFGLEYRFINRYLLGQLTENEMVEKLNTAIHQFAKRQMTFFRNIEKNGIRIHWIPEGNLNSALDLFRLK